MKAIAIVELPDDAFDDEAWGDGKWMIDDEGAIRYQEDDAWVHYKDIDVDGIELRPIPQRIEEGYPNDDYTIGKADGRNACIDEILSQHIESVENALEITDEEADCCGVQFWHDD